MAHAGLQAPDIPTPLAPQAPQQAQQILQYSKIGNTREQLFYTWWSFHFNENKETLDAYITCIRQVATLLGYGEPQILEVFKNTLPTKLYWVFFPTGDLRQAVETAKGILTKEKIDRQLAGQSFTTTFMNIKDNYNSKRVTFNMQDGLEDKIDTLTVIMGQLTMKDKGVNRQFKPKIYQSRGRGQLRNFYNKHNYNQQGYQNRYWSHSRDSRNQYRQNRGRPKYEQNYRNDYRRGKFRGNVRIYQNF